MPLESRRRRSSRPVTRQHANGHITNQMNFTYRTPSPLEEGCKEVNAYKRDIAGRWHGLACLRRADADEEANVEHGSRHGDRGPEQRLATTERISSEDQEAAAHDHLDDAIDAGGEETRFGAVEAEILEDLRSVVVAVFVLASLALFLQLRKVLHCVSASHLLAYH